MAGVVSAENFSIDLAASVTSNDAALGKSQTAANCIPYASAYVTTVGDTDHALYAVDARFTDGAGNPGTTHVEVLTSSAVTRAMTVKVCVVEYDPARVDVQQGTWSMADGVTSATLSPASLSAVTLANTFPYITGIYNGSTSYYDKTNYRAEITGTTTLGITRNTSGGTASGNWYTADATTGGDFTAQLVSVTLTGAQTSSTGTTGTTVTPGKAYVIGSHTTSAANFQNRYNTTDVTLEVDGDTVTVQRHGASQNVYGKYYVVEFTGLETVQRGTIAAQAATGTDDADFTTAMGDYTEAWAHFAGSMGSGASGSFPGSTTADIIDARCAISFLDSDTVRVQHDTTGNEGNNDISWEVIDFAIGGAPSVVRRVMVRG